MKKTLLLIMVLFTLTGCAEPEYFSEENLVEDMDAAILLVQIHCLKDVATDKEQITFCDSFIGKDEVDEKNSCLAKYVFSDQR